MEKKGLQNEKFIRKIKKDGSNAIKPKNEVGINVVDSKDTSSGLIAGKLIRPRYNEVELVKSIDTEIVELLPRQKPSLPDTVLRSTYNEALSNINDLTLTVEELEGNVGDLTSRVESLHATTESFKREIDGLTISKIATDEQLVVSQESFATAQTDLQIAIGNSLQEAIQRVSLTARNEALKQELDLLREQLFGLAAQTAEGATSGGNNKFTVKVNGSDPSTDGDDIKKTTSHEKYKDKVMGVTLEINNVTGDSKINNVIFNISGGKKWFKVTPGATQIEPQTAKTYKLEYDTSVIGGMDPYKKSGFLGIKYWSSKATDYSDTDLEVKVNFEDGTSDSVTLTTFLRKNRKN